MGPPKPTDDIFWKQYELHVELYKHYLKLLLEFNIFYYAATGAILSYYFSKPELPWMRFSLLFPVLMSLGFAGLFLYSANRATITRDDLFAIRDKLGLATAPEYAVLQMFLWISAGLMLAVGLSLLVIVIVVRLPLPVKQ